MAERSPVLSKFLNAHLHASEALPDSSVRIFFEKCHRALKKNIGKPNNHNTKELPSVCKHLPDALQLASKASAPTATLFAPVVFAPSALSPIAVL